MNVDVDFHLMGDFLYLNDNSLKHLDNQSNTRMTKRKKKASIIINKKKEIEY